MTGRGRGRYRGNCYREAVKGNRDILRGNGAAGLDGERYRIWRSGNPLPAGAAAKLEGDRHRHVAIVGEYRQGSLIESRRGNDAVDGKRNRPIRVNGGVDPRQADQNIRDNLVLPAGTGKTVRIALFDDTKVDGVDIAGVENVTKALDKGELNFDILIATPAQMPKLGKYARTLGPRGLMPNPKAGTVVSADNLARAIKEAKAGRVEFRLDKTANIHVSVGKVSFQADQLYENFAALMDAIHKARPSGAKGEYIKKITLSTTMGPGIKVNPGDTFKLEGTE